MMSTNCVSQVNQLQQLTQTTTQASLVPQKQNASIGVSMDVSEMNTAAMLDGSCVDMGGVHGMGMDPNHMMSNSNMHIGGGSGASNQMNGVSQIIGEIQNDATVIGQNQGT